MRAVAARAFREAPALLDLPERDPGETELKVRMAAAGVNPFDWKILDGIFDGQRPHLFPLIAGVDGAGTVEAVGASVRRFRVGDRIAGSFLHDPVGVGTYAELATVPETNALARLPERMPFESAAALPTSGMTAWEGLEHVGVRPGGTLLIVGASGGVGSLATALAAARGIRVLATARPSSEEMLRRLGAQELVDASGPDPVAEVRRRFPDGVDGLLDTGSDPATFARLAALVRRGGTAATTVHVADASTAAADGVQRINLNLKPRAEEMERLLAEVAAGRLAVPIGRTRPLAEGPRALAESRARTSVGKTVLRISEG
jgi:NADPH:quinone reductase